MKGKPSISRLIEFQQLLLKFRAIKRTVYIPPDNEELENDSEHSYNLALSAWFLGQYFPHIDVNRAVILALTHDLVEVHAGDTFSYGADKDAKRLREEAAQKQLAEEWPDFPELHEAIEEYESRSSEEAKFVYALDKLMPSMINYLDDGYFWKKHGITLDMFKHEKETKMPVSPEIYPYYHELLALLEEDIDRFFPAEEKPH